MAHFAQLDANDVVTRVLVVNNDDAPDEARGAAFLQELTGQGGWVQTSYNATMRGDFAGVGYSYNRQLDVFLPPRPYPSWTATARGTWEPPVPYPGGYCTWNETLQTWESSE